MSRESKPGFATCVGLFCALGVPLLIFFTRFVPTHSLPHLPHGLLGQEAIIWGLTALVVVILVFWERLPLSTIGLGRFRWNSLWWGIASAIAVRIVAIAAAAAYAEISGISLSSAFAHDIAIAEKLGSLRLGLILLLAVRAGVTEEILFRGYGIERLAAVTGNRTVAALASLAIFTIAHWGVWDVSYLIVVFPVGLVLTLQYLWRRDLWANIVAHSLTDGVSLLAAYGLAHHLVRLAASTTQ